LLKKSKSEEIISFTFPFIDAHSKIQREKRQLRNRFLCEIRQKDQNMTILGYSCGLQSSLYTKKSLLYFKSVDVLPKSYRFVCSRTDEFIESLSIKKLASIKLAKILA
jgi:hypothetical protein